MTLLPPGFLLVTGGAGFIGSHLAQDALARGQAVRILDNFATGRRDNLQFLEEHSKDRWEVMEGDITRPADCARAMEGAGAVTHQAALGSVLRSVEDPLATHQANTTGTFNIFNAAVKAGVRRVVYASSSSVYGDSPDLPKVEARTGAPLSPYAASKMACETYAAAFHLAYGLETVGLRYFNVFGPRQDPQSAYAAVIPLFIAAMRAGRPAVLHGEGAQSRDFTYIANVVQANRLALAAPAEKAAGRAFNIACGARTTIRELHDLLARLLGSKVPPTVTARRAGDVDHSLADISSACEALGYAPEIALEEGLRRTLGWTGAAV